MSKEEEDFEQMKLNEQERLDRDFRKADFLALCEARKAVFQAD